MNKAVTIISSTFCLILFLVNAALALDMEYYTYGGFNPITQAFTKIALIFSDSGYQGLLYVVTVLGIGDTVPVGIRRTAERVDGGADRSALTLVDPVEDPVLIGVQRICGLRRNIIPDGPQ